MANKLRISLFFLLLFSISGFGQGTTEIIGKIKKGRGTMVYLRQNTGRSFILIDSCKANFFGKYKLKAEVKSHDFYEMTIDKKETILVILKGNEKIKIKSTKDFKNKNYSVSGSKDSKLIQEYFKMKATDGISKDSIAKNALQFVKSNSESLACFVALNDVNNPKDGIAIAEKGIGKSYPNSNFHNSLKSALQQIAQAEKAQKSSKTQVGSVAPELNMVSPEGEIVTLASLKGKYVLIDFWASWCGPCRKENPSVVRLYNKYKDKGFEVYSVSLDKSKAKWVAAIKKDGLVWESHVSDLKGWRSAATKLYGFRGIPYTVLIDKEGKVIATRLRGGALERKMAQIFGE